MKKSLPYPHYEQLIDNIDDLLERARVKAYVFVNTLLVDTYWKIGKAILEYEQLTGEAAGYGSKLFEQITTDLRRKHGKGFSRSNIVYMRLFASKYSKSQTLSDLLGWRYFIVEGITIGGVA